MEPTSPLLLPDVVVDVEDEDVVVPVPSTIFGILKLLEFVVALSLLEGILG